MKRFAALIALGVLLGAGRVAGEILSVANPHLQLAVDRASGQWIEFRDRATAHNLLGGSAATGPLWELELAGAGPLTPTNARSVTVTPLRGKTPGLRWQWSGFGLAQSPELSVEATVTLERHQPVSHWRLAVHHHGGQAISVIHFPRVLHIAEQAGERLAVPAWLGEETDQPRALVRGGGSKPQRREWPYPGYLSLQCFALSATNGAGLYLACDDPAGQRKAFALFGGGDTGLNLEILHYPERDSLTRDTYTMPYAVVLGTFRGGWFDAAARYRAWATNQPWARASRLRQGQTPAWVTNTALWVWNRGPSPGVLTPAVALQQKLGLPVSVFWHWWHGCAYDHGFPEYLPPREGTAAFQAALQRAQAQDVHALVYMNQRLWGMTTASWTNQNAARFAVKNPAGDIRPEVYNTFTKAPCASMCMGTAFWRDTYAGLAAEAFLGLGVDGIYMDQACSSLACFDPTHGHPLGGGTYWMEGFQKLAADIRQRCATRGGPALAGEGCGENWLPHLDLMLALQVSRERYAGPDGWTPIPFFTAVYHGYNVYYGNYSSLTMPPYDELWPAEFAPREPLQLLDRKFSRQFYLEQARAFVWGQQPTLANFQPAQLQTRAEELDYLLRLARLHAGARPYLLHGTMLPPPKVTAPSAEQDMSRLSIYAGQRGGLTEFRRTVPQVAAAAWRAADGGVAVAVASLSDQPLTPTLELEAAACGLPRRGRVYRLDPDGRRLIGTFQGKTVRLQPALGPRDACLLELKRH
ncbi:MAG: hypothetical protein BWX84_02517 [Verrucomicrobia bacterium ADurb.Bin118]|nr:MAG: hypothetical protein BWX84_02517 [Verrucomicrobia bacterium ADurb.Bin118]